MRNLSRFGFKQGVFMVLRKRNNPYDLNVLLLLKGAIRKVEGALHGHFADCRYRREWFLYNKNIKMFVRKDGKLIKRVIKKLLFDIPDLEI